MSAGRFAPSPSGDLHVGNLRTALLAWLFARTTGRHFLLRVEDLDRVAPGAEARQIADLLALGLDFDGQMVRQSERLALYASATEGLQSRGLVYECFCTRREISQAVSAPHAPLGAYPGTCRNLTDAERAERRKAGRAPALRLRSDTTEFTVIDEIVGEFTGLVDDFVIRRGDGTPAYNLAVVVDDAQQGVDQVVRGDDLLSSAPRQSYLATLLGFRPPRYVHVPLALAPDGKRLAKRDGAVTLTDRAALGESPADVLAWLARSLGLSTGHEQVTSADLRRRFDPTSLPRTPWFVLDDRT